MDLLHSNLDDGSTGMEVAIKMAMRLWDTRAKRGLIKSYQSSSDSDDSEDLVEDNMKKLVVLTQRDCYHGEISDIRALDSLLLMDVHSCLHFLLLVTPSGDTLGTMDTAEAGPFNQSQHPWYRPRTVALSLPVVAYRNGRLSIDASEMGTSCPVGELRLSNLHQHRAET